MGVRNGMELCYAVARCSTFCNLRVGKGELMKGTDCCGTDSNVLEYWFAYLCVDYHLLGHDFVHQSLWCSWIRRM